MGLQLHFGIQATSIGETLVLEVLGGLDALTAPQLVEAIMASLADQPAALIVDLSKLDFLGSAGMTALVDSVVIATHDLGLMDQFEDARRLVLGDRHLHVYD